MTKNNSEYIYKEVLAGLTEFLEKTYTADVVVGLSGGLDSSLVAALACEVLGPDHVHGVLMPGPFSSEHSITDAKELAKNLGMKTQTISITPAYETFLETFKSFDTSIDGVALENTQARCRMIVLMALANQKSWMVLNTGNRSEAMMGYSTLYGDTVGAFAPIGGVYKTDAFELARFMNERAKAAGKTPPIPEHVITKPPSAELAPNQTDEASLGSYQELDAILKAYVEYGYTEEEIAQQGFNAFRVRRVISRMYRYKFKRDLEPPFKEIPYADLR